jgi:hypothetical protein
MEQVEEYLILCWGAASWQEEALAIGKPFGPARLVVKAAFIMGRRGDSFGIEADGRRRFERSGVTDSLAERRASAAGSRVS